MYIISGDDGSDMGDRGDDGMTIEELELEKRILEVRSADISRTFHI